MKRRSIAQLLLLALSAVALWAAASPASATSRAHAVRMESLEVGVLADLNAFRKENGLPALRLSVALSRAARQHSMEMAARGYFSHNSANGSTFDKRIARFYPMGFHRFWSVGENLLWSSPDVGATGAINMWINSPEHKANMLNRRWREIGLAAVHSDAAPGTYSGRPVTIVTTDFGVRR
ncbi:MAG: CAP domain-containing protein [Actinobacteria bacterium]|nr:MAG: CAP domain-containing protein [Actinomycetota bacterium]